MFDNKAKKVNDNQEGACKECMSEEDSLHQYQNFQNVYWRRTKKIQILLVFFNRSLFVNMEPQPKGKYLIVRAHIMSKSFIYVQSKFYW